MINKTDMQYSLSENSQEINLSSILKKLKRNTLFILSITTLSTIFSIYYASIQVPIFKGQFQILVRDDEKENRNNASSKLINIPGARLNVSNTFKETQALILTSPMVLNPIYEFAKTEYKERKDNISTLSYDNWLKNNIEFKFVKDSDVFEITFKDRDKKFIKSILNMISEKYKKYSKEEYNKNLNRELNYLKKQEKIYIAKYEKSFKKSNDFVVENNLYNKNNQILQSNLDNSKLKNFNQAKIRYFDQFSLLDDYELKLAKYSSILKPNSEYMSELNSQISKLKKITQKPTRILLQKEFLNKSMLRDEVTLENIKNQIITNNLALARQKDPWELISTPTVDELKISPNRKNIVFTFFFLSFVITSFLSFLKEIFIGRIDDINIIKSIFKADFVNVISLSFSEINAKLLEFNFENMFFKKNIKESKNIGIYYQDESELISDYVEKNKKLSYVDFLDFKKMNDISDILIFLDSGKVTFDQIYKLNKFVDLYEEKNFYWFYVED